MLDKKQFFLKLSVVTIIVNAALLFWTSQHFVMSFFAGCVLMMLNFYTLLSLMDGIFGEDNVKAGSYLFLLIGKFAGLGIVIFVLVKFAKMDLMGFGLGFFLIAISASYATSTAKRHVE